MKRVLMTIGVPVLTLFLAGSAGAGDAEQQKGQTAPEKKEAVAAGDSKELDMSQNSKMSVIERDRQRHAIKERAAKRRAAEMKKAKKNKDIRSKPTDVQGMK